MEPGAILARVAESHVRFGHFEYFHHRDEPENVKRLADHVIEHHYPAFADTDNPYAAMYSEVVRRTARLIARWYAVGFVHGVMNTDNMSILGLTIDYGPYAFLDDYDRRRITNHSDHGGRYVLANQPAIGLWNLKALAVALTSLVDHDSLTAGLEEYSRAFNEAADKEFGRKLGFRTSQPTDEKLVADVLDLLEKAGADHTVAWRGLSGQIEEGETLPGLSDDAQAAIRPWLTRWRARLSEEEGSTADKAARLNAVNPRFVLRNWVAETAIRAVEDEFDLGTLDRIFGLLTSPYDAEMADPEGFAGPPPETMADLCVSCSS